MTWEIINLQARAEMFLSRTEWPLQWDKFSVTQWNCCSSVTQSEVNADCAERQIEHEYISLVGDKEYQAVQIVFFYWSWWTGSNIYLGNFRHPTGILMRHQPSGPCSYLFTLNGTVESFNFGMDAQIIQGKMHGCWTVKSLFTFHSRVYF